MKTAFLPKFVGISALLGILIGHDNFADARSYDLTVQICNYTDYTIYGALGYYYDDEKYSTGWYRVRPDRCTTLISGVDGPVYLFAQTEDDDQRWVPREGYATELFCINDDVDRDFIHESDDCNAEDFFGLERWFGRVVDSNNDGYALFNVWE